MSKNKKYHTILSYVELHKEAKKIDEDSSKHAEWFNSLSDKEKKERVLKMEWSFFDDFDEVFTIDPFSNLYHDITKSNKNPDYRTIEILLHKKNDVLKITDDAIIYRPVVYNGYKVNLPNISDTSLPISYILHLGSNLNSHLLGYLGKKSSKTNFTNIEVSLKKISEVFNESLDNIILSLSYLKNLKLIDYTKKEKNIIFVSLNQNKLLTLDKKYNDCSFSKMHLNINLHYKEFVFNKFVCPCCEEYVAESDLGYNDIIEYFNQEKMFSTTTY